MNVAIILLAAISNSHSAVFRDPDLQHVDTVANRVSFGVVGRKPSTGIDQFPFQAAILRNNQISCAGSIYSESCIITAANCTKENGKYFAPDALSVRVGSLSHSKSGQVHTVHKTIVHPGYDAVTLDNDIAILKLSSPIVFGLGASPVRLGSKEPKHGTLHTLAGWGKTGECRGEILHSEDIPIISREACQEVYPAGYITDNMICTKAMAGGDKGGPLFQKGTNMQVGLSSWYGCGGSDSPDVFTNTANYVEWIKSACAE